MSNYTHILVGLDLTDECQHILTKAKTLAEQSNAQLSIAHIIEPLAFAYGGDVPIDLTEAQRVIEEQAKTRLQSIADTFDIHEQNQIISIGHTSGALREIAEAKEADLIVVGSHGRHGLALILGSTANGVLKGAKCDVLAVRV